MDIKLRKAQLEKIDVLIRHGAKLNAIKTLRDFFRSSDTDEFGNQLPSRIGLKEAKEAVERREWDLDLQDTDPGTGQVMRRGRTDGGSKILLRQPIRRIVCDFGDGEVELDMDGLSLKSLSGLNNPLLINDVVEMIDLYKRIKEWDEGDRSS